MVLDKAGSLDASPSLGERALLFPSRLFRRDCCRLAIRAAKFWPKPTVLFKQ